MTEVRQRRQRRKTLTDTMIANLARRPKRYPLSDPQQVGHFVRVMPKGPHVFIATARDPYGKQVWTTLGSTDDLKIEEAREKARTVRKRVAQGLPAVEPPPPEAETFAAVAENWLKRYVHKNGVRTTANIERILRVYVLPYWSGRDFTSIKRRDIAGLLDAVEDKHGMHMADKVGSVLRSVAAWYSDRTDDFINPFAKLKSRVPKEKRKRSRVLTDDEVRAIWKAADESGAFGALVQLLLLTGQRRDKVVTMHWNDIAADGPWTIRTEPREKPNAGTLKLPEVALAIIQAQPRLVGSPFVFARRRGFDFRAKRALDAKAGVFGWRLHDLRRTARTLLSRAGVQPHVAERCLGHVQGAIEATYDRHDYHAEKGDALRKLATLIEIIVAGPTDGSNVVHFEATAS